MAHSPLRILLLSTILLANFAASASAATPAQIHRDAADGSIDGTYSLADLRDADRAVSSEQREYFGWDDAFREKLRGLSAPAPLSGAAPTSGRSEGVRGAGPARRSPDSPKRGLGGTGDAPAANESHEAADLGAASAGTEESDASPSAEDGALDAGDAQVSESSAAGSLSPVWLLAVLPLFVLGEGVRRAMRIRRDRSPQR